MTGILQKKACAAIEIGNAVSKKYKFAIERIKYCPLEGHFVGPDVCRDIVEALETIPNGAGQFSAPCTIEDLLVVFRAAVKRKSSVFIS